MEDNADYLLHSCGQTNHTSTRWNCQRAKENLHAFVDKSIHDIEMCSTTLQLASSSIFYSFVEFSERLQRVPVTDDWYAERLSDYSITFMLMDHSLIQPRQYWALYRKKTCSKSYFPSLMTFKDSKFYALWFLIMVLLKISSVQRSANVINPIQICYKSWFFRDYFWNAHQCYAAWRIYL